MVASGCTSRNFYPRPPRGGRPVGLCCRVSTVPFLSTPSARRATLFVCPVLRGVHISIHALREEGDGRIDENFSLLRYFYPRPPRGGRPAPAGSLTDSSPFLSTPSARRATVAVVLGTQIVDISIHALREEGDPYLLLRYLVSPTISIHALREEGDVCRLPRR